MASGDVCGIIGMIVPPATLFAALTTRAGASTPAEQIPTYAFDAATIEYLDFYGRLEGYAGGGLTVSLPWIGATATTGVARLGVAFRRLEDDVEDVDVSHTYDYNEVNATCASASGEVAYDNVTFTNGADMDSLATGEAFIMRVRRNASDAADTMAGDAQLLADLVLIKET